MTTENGDRTTHEPDGHSRPEAELIDSVWKACAYGDLDKLKEFIELNPSSAQTPDDQVKPSTTVSFKELYLGLLSTSMGGFK